MSDNTTRERRRLGRNGPETLAIGLGCMSLSGTYGTSDDTAAIDLIHRALDLGVDHLDSSDMYGWGHNELVIGRALKGRRDRVVLASKFGQTQNPGGPNGVIPYIPGMTIASGAGFFWALYIVFGQRAGAAHGAQATALGTVVAAVVVLPFGIVHAGAALLAPAVIVSAIGVAPA